MYDQYIKAKELLSTVKNRYGQEIYSLSLGFESPITFFTGYWNSSEVSRIKKEDHIFFKDKKDDNNTEYFSSIITELEYLRHPRADTHMLFSLKESDSYFIQIPKNPENLKESICFSHEYSQSLNSFYPKDEFGQIRLCNSYHEYMLGNSVLLQKETVNFNKNILYFFKIDHIDKNYLHIFKKTGEKYDMTYIDRFKMVKKFPFED